MRDKPTLLLLLLFTLLLASNAFAESKVNRSDVEYLGSPFGEKYDKKEEIYARNIWDIQHYNGLIFLGAGNSSNRGPAQNAGPVPIIFYDPKQNEFIREGMVNEEQIDLYYVMNNQLYIPGHDPTDSWRLGNFYQRLENGYWMKYRNIPKALHSYAMAWHNNKMFLGLGLKKGSAISVSSDNGKTWSNIPAGKSRVYSFLQVAHKLYAIKKIKNKSYDKKKNYTGVLEFQEPDKLIPRPDLTDKVMFPDIKIVGKWSKKIVKPTAIGDKSIYIGAYTHNDHQFEPFGVFIASSLEKKHDDIKRIRLPKKTVPWDILTTQTFTYLLLSKSTNDKTTEVIVMRSPTSALQDWEKLLSFTSSTFARSFEIVDGDFYFGLGSEVKNSKNWSLKELKPDTGSILRIKKHYIRN